MGKLKGLVFEGSKRGLWCWVMEGYKKFVGDKLIAGFPSRWAMGEE